MIFNLRPSDFFQTQTIQFLRSSFAQNSQYTFTEDPKTTKIHIYRDYPIKVTTRPLVLVQPNTIAGFTRQYQDEIIRQEVKPTQMVDGSVEDVLFTVHIGTITSTMGIHVIADTTRQSDLISDDILWYFRISNTSWLKERGIDWTDLNKNSKDYTLKGALLNIGTAVNVTLFAEYEYWKPVTDVGTILGFIVRPWNWDDTIDVNVS